jgi:hypothetical protein
MDNPFSYGSPVEGPRFTDREEELAALVACMANGQNVILSAPRRFGKSSLLKAAVVAARERGVRVGMARLMGCSSKEQVAQRLAAAISDQAMGWLQGHVEEFRRHLASIGPGVSLMLTEDGFRVSVAPGTTGEADWGEVTRGLIRAAARIGGGERRVALVLDEFQRVAEVDGGSLPGVFKDLVDELPNVSLVVAGSTAHLMRMLTEGGGAPLMGIGQRITLGPIPEDRMVAFLSARFAAGGQSITQDAAHTLCDLAHGVPNSVQQLAFWTFEERAEKIDAAVVEKALDRAVSLQDQEFTDKFERLSPLQQRILLLLASQREPYAGLHRKETYRILGASPNGVTTAVRALSETEIVVDLHPAEPHTPSRWQILDCFFARWVARLG